MCPFAQIVGEDKFKDNFGNFGNCYHKFPQIDWEDAIHNLLLNLYGKTKLKNMICPGCLYIMFFRKEKNLYI